MVGTTVAPIRPIDRHRMEVMRYYIGCLPCLLMGIPDRHTSIEHMTDAGRRVGGDEQHQHTAPMCNWHHFGSLIDMPEEFGPSLANGRKPFEEHFGPEEVLVKVTTFLVDLFDETPWPEHEMPSHVALAAREEWRRLTG